MSPRRLEFWPFVSLLGLLTVVSGGERALAQQRPSNDPMSLPNPPIEGGRVGLTVGGGWDSNAEDRPDGQPDLVYEMGGSVIFGAVGRRGVFGFSAEGFRQGFRELRDRSIWRGTSRLIAGWRPGRRLVIAAGAGATFDYADNLLRLDGLLLPRTEALAVYGDGRLSYRLGRRTSWVNDLRYDEVLFQSALLPDTESLRARSSLERQLGRADDLAVSYVFLRSRWEDAEDDNHSLLGVWKHRMRHRWSFEIAPGVTRAEGLVEQREGARWLFVGGLRLSRQTSGSTLDITYRRFVAPGYGFGGLLYTDSFAVAMGVSLTDSLRLNGDASVDRSQLLVGPSIDARSTWAGVSLVTALSRSVSLVARYRFRWRDYRDGQTIEGHRVGLAVTSSFSSRRSRNPDSPEPTPSENRRDVHTLDRGVAP